MRKMKKINGYLVVRFNDREKRENEDTGLGSYGVIDAEFYTGVLDVDREVMEYDDAETLEIAIEQARSLESELDVEEAEAVFTVIKETDEGSSEEGPFCAADMFNAEQSSLKSRIRAKHFPDIDPVAAVHELYGYRRALKDLGMIDEHDERFIVDGELFGTVLPPPAPERRAETLAYICDEICKHRTPGRTQEELDAICEKCRVDRWAGAPPMLTPQEVRELRQLQGLLKEVSDYVNEKPTPYLPHQKKAERSLQRLKTEMSEGVTLQTIQKLLNAASSDEPPRETFENAPSGVKNGYNTKKVYALGLALTEECPENDCKVYLNIFNMARELDAALGMMEGNTAPALALRSALMDRLGELWEMYSKNYAVQQF